MTRQVEPTSMPSTSSNRRAQRRRAQRLINALRRLEEERDRATLARLRRGLGKPLGSAPERDAWVLRHFPTDAQRAELERSVLVASLFALHPQAGGSGGLGSALRQSKRGDDDEATERRFVALLNSNAADLPHRLRQIVTLLKSRGVPVDWKQLLRHLWYWDRPDRFVQFRWSQEFWSRRPDEKASSATSPADAVE
jgi:CRISPR system Cascade subunit CasB